MKNGLTLWTAFFILFHAASAYAEIDSTVRDASVGSRVAEFSTTIQADGGTIAGFTKYQIGASYFPISELKFPTNVVMAGITLRSETENGTLFSLILRRNFSQVAGKMEDSDWGIAAATNPAASLTDLDIFSSSDASLNTWRLGGHVQLPIRSKLEETTTGHFTYGGGYLFDNYRYNVSNLDQYSPSGLSNVTAFVEGTVLTYEMSHHFPYLSVGYVFDSPLVSGSILVGFSPWVSVADRDDHVLRNKISTGIGRGTGVLGEVSLKFPVMDAPNWKFRVKGAYLDSQTAGRQSQLWYADELYGDGSVRTPKGTSVEIDYKTKRTEYSIIAGLDYRF
ncbi:MAG: outer membrane protease [Candidatus Marinamargulisbacteria bacterium]|jgi:outer membrane protease